MQEIEDTTVVSGLVDVDGNLLLEKRNGSQINAGLVRGAVGSPGAPGAPGAVGLSAYEVWLGQGNVGTEADFIEDITGASGTLPVGAVVDWPKNAATPTYALDCLGQAVSRSVYSSLFGVLGTTFGVGNGSTTFNLPKFNRPRPVFIVHNTSFGRSGASGWSKMLWGAGTTGIEGTVNEGGHYDTTNSRFVAPYDGVYEFKISMVSTSEAGNPVVDLYRNGVNAKRLAIIYRHYNNAFGQALIRLNKNDIIETYLLNNNGTTVNVGGWGTSFSGVYLGPLLEDEATSDTRKIIIATDQGSGVVIIKGDGGYTLGQIVEWPRGAPIPANHLELNGQSVLTATYSALAALFPGWVSGANLVLPNLQVEPVAQLLATANQNTSGPGIYINWSSDQYNSGMWSSANPSRLYPNKIGRWRISAKVRVTVSSGVGVYGEIRKNRVVDAHTTATQDVSSDTMAAIVRTEIIHEIQTVGTDYVEFWLAATAGTPATIASQTSLIAEYLGPVDGYETDSPSIKIICAADSAGEYSPTVQTALVGRVSKLENLLNEVYVDAASRTFSTSWSLGPTTPVYDNLNPLSRLKLFYQWPGRNDEVAWGGVYIEPQVCFKVDGVWGSWQSLGSSGYELMVNSVAEILTYSNTLFINPEINSVYSVQFRWYAKSYQGTAQLNLAHDINAISGTATLMAGANGTQHYFHAIVEEVL